MKPLRGEYVKGTDTKGNNFSMGIVRDSSASQSSIILPDGTPILADHTDIKGEMDPDN